MATACESLVSVNGSADCEAKIEVNESINGHKQEDDSREHDATTAVVVKCERKPDEKTDFTLNTNAKPFAPSVKTATVHVPDLWDAEQKRHPLWSAPFDAEFDSLVPNFYQQNAIPIIPSNLPIPVYCFSQSPAPFHNANPATRRNFPMAPGYTNGRENWSVMRPSCPYHVAARPRFPKPQRNPGCQPKVSTKPKAGLPQSRTAIAQQRKSLQNSPYKWTAKTISRLAQTTETSSACDSHQTADAGAKEVAKEETKTKTKATARAADKDREEENVETGSNNQQTQSAPKILTPASKKSKKRADSAVGKEKQVVIVTPPSTTLQLDKHNSSPQVGQSDVNTKIEKQDSQLKSKETTKSTSPPATGDKNQKTFASVVTGEVPQRKKRGSGDETARGLTPFYSTRSSFSGSINTVADMDAVRRSKIDHGTPAKADKPVELSPPTPDASVSATESDDAASPKVQLSDANQAAAKPYFDKDRRYRIGLCDWLKDKRLIKYFPLLCTMKAQEMMNLTLEEMMDLGMTLGAANKLVRDREELAERFTSGALERGEFPVLTSAERAQLPMRIPTIRQRPDYARIRSFNRRDERDAAASRSRSASPTRSEHESGDPSKITRPYPLYTSSRPQRPQPCSCGCNCSPGRYNCSNGGILAPSYYGDYRSRSRPRPTAVNDSDGANHATYLEQQQQLAYQDGSVGTTTVLVPVTVPVTSNGAIVQENMINPGSYQPIYHDPTNNLIYWSDAYGNLISSVAGASYSGNAINEAALQDQLKPDTQNPSKTAQPNEKAPAESAEKTSHKAECKQQN